MLDLKFNRQVATQIQHRPPQSTNITNIGVASTPRIQSLRNAFLIFLNNVRLDLIPVINKHLSILAFLLSSFSSLPVFSVFLPFLLFVLVDCIVFRIQEGNTRDLQRVFSVCS